MINIFVELGRRITTTSNEEVYRRAQEENNWFSIKDITNSIEAIQATMLNQKKISDWLKHYPNLPTKRAEKVLIIMAGNIPLVGLFDLLSVLMAGHIAIVKPSHKDRILIEWIIEELRAIEPSIPIYNYEEGVEPHRYDRIIATGGDAAMLHFKSRYRALPTLLRGSRHSIAVVTDGFCDTLRDDIYSYSGLGCRNVSLIFVPKGYDLSKIPTLPLESLNQKYRNNYLQNRALLTISKVDFYDSSSSCFIYQDCFPIEISTISIVEYDSIVQVERWIERYDRELQCIVAKSDVIEHPRRVEFGEAQRPTLFDYADGIDTMKFLE